jgi:hypothetical protein
MANLGDPFTQATPRAPKGKPGTAYYTQVTQLFDELKTRTSQPIDSSTLEFEGAVKVEAVAGGAEVTGDLAVSEDLDVTGDAAVGGDLTVTGDINHGTRTRQLHALAGQGKGGATLTSGFISGTIGSTNLLQNGSSSNVNAGSSYTTASASPTAGRYWHLWIYTESSSGTAAAGTPTGLSLTWTSIRLQADADGATRGQLQVYEGTGTPTAGTIAIAISGGNATRATWVLVEFDDVCTLAPRVQDVGVQSHAPVLAAMVTGSATVAGFGWNDNSTVTGIEAGYTDTGVIVQIEALMGLQTTYKHTSTGDATPTITLSGAPGRPLAIAIELYPKALNTWWQISTALGRVVVPLELDVGDRVTSVEVHGLTSAAGRFGGKLLRAPEATGVPEELASGESASGGSVNATITMSSINATLADGYFYWLEFAGDLTTGQRFYSAAVHYDHPA